MFTRVYCKGPAIALITLRNHLTLVIPNRWHRRRAIKRCVVISERQLDMKPCIMKLVKRVIAIVHFFCPKKGYIRSTILLTVTNCNFLGRASTKAKFPLLTTYCVTPMFIIAASLPPACAMVKAVMCDELLGSASRGKRSLSMVNSF